MKEKNTIRNSISIFLLCLAVHTFEVLVIRTDETFFAECFINKVFGLVFVIFLFNFAHASHCDAAR